MKILCFGSLNIDHTYQVDHFLSPGETMATVGYEIHVGGKGLNQCIALAKAGADVYMAGCIGRDGSELLATLQQAGAKTEFVRETHVPTGHAVIQVDGSGRNCILICHSANFCILSEQIDKTLCYFSRGDILLLQNEINQINTIAQKARAIGMEIWLNPSPITLELLTSEAISLADGLVLNEVELKALSGLDDLENSIRVLRSRYPKQTLVVTLGAKGSVCLVEKEIYQQAAFPVKSVDTTGAGDTFLGYFLANYSSSRSPALAMKIAAKAASIAVTRRGAAESIPCIHEVDHLP